MQSDLNNHFFVVQISDFAEDCFQFNFNLMNFVSNAYANPKIFSLLLKALTVIIILLASNFR